MLLIPATSSNESLAVCSSASALSTASSTGKLALDGAVEKVMRKC